MKHYSRLCQVSRNDFGSSTQELDSSKGLNTFMRQLGIMNLQEGFDAVARDLADFRKLTDFGELSDRERPMLIRYSPIDLSKRPGWARDVKPFLALCGSGLDSAGNIYHHTSFFRSDLLLNDDVFNYLDHLFGTRFVGPEGIEPGDLDRDPDRVEPVLRMEDALVVKLAAAALLQNWPVVLKLEKDCVFNRRAMDLLSQIYSLIPPELAVLTGYSSYQDPRQLEDLLQRTPIRIFLTHADCVCSAGDPRFLFFDMNQPVNLQASDQQYKGFLVSKNLFTYITYWHSMPWRERQPLMKLLFCNEKDLPNEQSYCTVTRHFVQTPFIQWINRLPDRETYTTLEQLKEKYDSFPICGQIPILREKFCLTIPQLLKPPLTLDTLGGDLRHLLAHTPKDTEDYGRLLELDAFFLLLQSVCTASDTQKAQVAQETPKQSATELAASQEAHARQIRQLEQAFSDQISQLKAENQTLRTAYEQERMSLEQETARKLHEAEQAFAGQLFRLQAENQTLRTASEQERMSLEQETARKLHEAEQAFAGQLSRLQAENQTLRETHVAELATLSEQLAQLHTENQYLHKTHAEQLEDLQRSSVSALDEKAAALAKLQLEYDNALTMLQLEYKSELEAAKAKYQADIEQANEAIRRQRQLHEEELADAKARYQAGIEQANEAIRHQRQLHAEEMAAMEEKHKADIEYANASIRLMNEERAKLAAHCQHLEHQLDSKPNALPEGKRGHWWKK